MRLRDRRLPSALIPVFIAVAIVGYLIGSSRSQGASAEKLRTAAGAHVVLNYPPGWRPVRKGPGIPGLPITEPILLAPGGDAAQAGLLAGTLPPSELSPLPGKFVASMRELPETAVVNLVEIQAYRYERLSIPGFDRMLSLFVIPNPHGNPTALACYAAPGHSATMRTCEGIVATVTLVAQNQTYELTPETTFARRVSGSMATLNTLRVALRRQLRPNTTPARAQALATQLAAAFAHASVSLAALEPSFAAAQAQDLLSESVAQTRVAYTALAAAAAGNSAAEYAAARKRVYGAESNVNWALESFALLGYDPAAGSPSGSSS
jgi:hypothetical protein